MSRRVGGREDAGRRDEILDRALEVLAERGYRDASMLEVARRAGASKETLYSWFGNKAGLFGEVVSRQSDGIGEALSRRFEAEEEDTELYLTEFGALLLKLLLGERAVIINRAAISEAARDPAFAEILARRGRGTVVPGLRAYLEKQREYGRLDFDDSTVAAETYIALVVRDRQVRRFLGVVPELSDAEARGLASEAVGIFMRLYGGDRG